MNELNGKDSIGLMMLPPWNNFLWSFLCFIMVRSNHDEGLVRISLRLKPITFGFELGRFRPCLVCELFGLTPITSMLRQMHGVLNVD
jgi:hypothetical protein